MKRNIEPRIRIIIGQRGWVWVGKVAYEEINDWYSEVVITHSYCIRTWGTDNGLGELRDGPREQTVLDKVGEIRVHELAVVATYEVDEKIWAAKLLADT